MCCLNFLSFLQIRIARILCNATIKYYGMFIRCFAFEMNHFEIRRSLGNLRVVQVSSQKLSFSFLFLVHVCPSFV